MEKIIAGVLEVATDADVHMMEQYVHVDYSYTTWKEAKAMIVEAFVELILKVQEHKGEYAEDYRTRMDYVERNGFERDYFDSWVYGCSDYPCLDEIVSECGHIQMLIEMWFWAVEEGWIDPEAGWAEEGDSYWAYEADNQKWILWSHTEDDEVQIAEVGQDEDGTYYWIEIESTCGYCDFATAEKAMADADHYFDKQAAEAIYQARKNIG